MKRGPIGIAGAVQYAIPHIVARAHVQQKGKKPLYPLEGKLVRVEEYASYLLQQAGWTVYKGDDAHLFFSVFSCNFKDSFFREVCRNWVGPTAEDRIARLDAAVSQSIANHALDPHLIEEAEEMLLNYYSTYPPKRAVHTAIAQHIRSFDHGLLLKLLRFYRTAGYKTKGAPDLFLASNGSFCFVEVKSHTDSLSSEQYDFFEGYLTSVSDNILVLRVMPEGLN
jgi:hypothetical protein